MDRILQNRIYVSEHGTDMYVHVHAFMSMYVHVCACARAQTLTLAHTHKRARAPSRADAKFERTQNSANSLQRARTLLPALMARAPTRARACAHAQALRTHPTAPTLGLVRVRLRLSRRAFTRLAAALATRPHLAHRRAVLRAPHARPTTCPACCGRAPGRGRGHGAGAQAAGGPPGGGWCAGGAVPGAAAGICTERTSAAVAGAPGRARRWGLRAAGCGRGEGVGVGTPVVARGRGGGGDSFAVRMSVAAGARPGETGATATPAAALRGGGAAARAPLRALPWPGILSARSASPGLSARALVAWAAGQAKRRAGQVGWQRGREGGRQHCRSSREGGSKAVVSTGVGGHAVGQAQLRAGAGSAAGRRRRSFGRLLRPIALMRGVPGQIPTQERQPAQESPFRFPVNSTGRFPVDSISRLSAVAGVSVFNLQ
jgi:hypothetical protein